MAGKLIIEAISSRAGASIASALPESGQPRRAAELLRTYFEEMAAGIQPGHLRVSVDESTGVAASQTIACTQASATAGDVVVIGGIAFTAVATTPVPANGEFAIITSDTAMATSLKAAINAHPATRGRFTADSSSGTVTVTAAVRGTFSNGIEVRKVVTTGAAITLGGATLTGGRDPGDRQTLTAALGGALSINDTVTIGSVVLTAVAVPANENEFVGAVSAAADGAALAACINAHSKLKGLLYATGTATVTIRCLIGGRIGALVSISKSAAQITLSAASFAPTTTEAYSAGAGGLEYTLGLP